MPGALALNAASAGAAQRRIVRKGGGLALAAYRRRVCSRVCSVGSKCQAARRLCRGSLPTTVETSSIINRMCMKATLLYLQSSGPAASDQHQQRLRTRLRQTKRNCARTKSVGCCQPCRRPSCRYWEPSHSGLCTASPPSRPRGHVCKCCAFAAVLRCAVLPFRRTCHVAGHLHGEHTQRGRRLIRWHHVTCQAARRLVPASQATLPAQPWHNSHISTWPHFVQYQLARQGRQ